MQNDWFIKIFNSYIDDIYRLAFSYTHNKADADDITQKVFLKFYKNISKINRNKQEVKKWLIITTINECKDLFKAPWKKKIMSITNEESLIAIQFNSDYDLKDYLNKLPYKYRLIIHLYYYYGYTTKEIAKLLKLKDGTIRKRLSRAREILRIRKEEENEKI